MLFLIILEAVVFIVTILNRKELELVSLQKNTHISEMQPSVQRFGQDRYYKNTLLFLGMDDYHPFLIRN